MLTNSPINTHLYVHRTSQTLSERFSRQWLMQQLTTDHSAEDNYQQNAQPQLGHLDHPPARLRVPLQKG